MRDVNIPEKGLKRLDGIWHRNVAGADTWVWQIYITSGTVFHLPHPLAVLADEVPRFC